MDSTSSTRRLTIFFILTFAISWLLWLPQVLTSNDIAQLPEFTGFLGMLAPFGPFIAAIVLTGRQSGRSGVRKLWRRGWTLAFDKRWLLPTILLMPLVSLVTVGALMLLGESIEWEHSVGLAGLIPAFFFIYLLNALPEEYGWRGYALGRMLPGRNALIMSLGLGIIWGLWHLPLHFIDGSVQSNIPVYQFVLQQAVLAIFYTWLYVNTRGAVSVAILFHTIGNIMGAAVPHWATDLGRWVGFAVLLVFAAIITAYWGPRHLSRSSSEYEAALAATEES